jgi:hypothetical protein
MVLPKRSERRANKPLPSVPSSKRAEVVLMQRFGVAEKSTNTTPSIKAAYAKFYADEARDKHFEAMSDLLPALRCNAMAVGLQA